MFIAEFFIKGLIVGFLVAAPIGPVAVMCIHRTLNHGRLSGHVCGLGASFADTVLGAIAALGLGFLAHEIVANQNWLRLVGGAVLCLLGLRMVFARRLSGRTKAQEMAETLAEAKGLRHPAAGRQGFDAHFGNFASAFVVMLTNPVTLFSFIALFAAIDIGRIGEELRWGGALVLGIFAGSVLWWSLLTLLSSLFRHHLGSDGLLWINRVSGALILAFGMVVLFWPATLDELRGLDI